MANRRETLGIFRAALRSVGYDDSCIATDYGFANFEDRRSVVQQVDLAAFAGYPRSYRNSCIGVIFRGEGADVGAAYVDRFRSFGAPLIFEVADTQVQPWRIGGRETRPDGKVFALDSLERTFDARRNQWNPFAVGRLKTASDVAPNNQLDLYDAGLLPVLSEFFQTKLKDLLERAFADTAQCFQEIHGKPPAVTDIFPYLFRFVTAKIFMDRADARGWENLSTPRQIFDKAEAHCGAGLMQFLPATFLHKRVLEKAWQSIEQHFHFQNLSVPDLAFIYESSFINDDTRRQLGIHSTPVALADYIVDHLPWNDIPVAERKVFEPFCGHGIFLARSLERLGKDLDPNLSAKQRHKYFRDMLVGVEKDPLAIEVCRLVLTLSDYPNDNSWQLHSDDVFKWHPWKETLKSSAVVLANPPYESFPEEERSGIGATKAHPPAELIHRMMQDPPRMFGLVLPQSFLSSPFYSDANRQIAERYEDVSIVELPRVFRYADNETVVVLAHHRREKGVQVNVNYAEVRGGAASELISTLELTEHRSQKVKLRDDFSFWLPPKRSWFEQLDAAPRLGAVTKGGKGLDWIRRVDGKSRADQRDDVASNTARAGFHRGVEKMRGNLSQMQLRRFRYLSLLPEHHRARDKAWARPWNERKVVCNAARFERRSPWRLAAWADADGLVFTKHYFCFWPIQGISEFALAAILSSPVANAFSATHDLERHNHIATIEKLPLPALEHLRPSGTLHRQAKKLQGMLAASDFAAEFTEEEILEQFMRLDAAVLSAYGLPARTQYELLARFHGWRRPIPAKFTGYFPEGFKDVLSLPELVEIQYNWDEINERRCDLIEKDIGKKRLSAEEREELDRLQALADSVIRLKAPYPLAELDGMVEKLKAQGKWNGST